MNSDRQTQKILIVDDAPTNIKVLIGTLKNPCYEILAATSGEAALDIAASESPDLILLDIMMPKMDGHEVCRRLKADNNTMNIPVIFITAMNEEEDETEGLGLGAADYITKPISSPIVKARVKTQLKLRRAYEELEKEKAKSDKLLLNVLPARVANDLKETGKTEPECFENVTVYFSDVVGFTKLSSSLEPKVLIEELNDIFTAFDNIAEENQCERVKTIGDAYLCVCGMPEENPRHAENIVKSAVSIIQYLKKRNETSEISWEVRIGIHTGKVVGGVVGVKKYIYDVFGDTINTASRMESNSEAMKINLSESTYQILKDKFKFTQRGTLSVKGKGDMKMYFLEV